MSNTCFAPKHDDAPNAAGALQAFASLPAASEDAAHVANGIRAELLYAWGDPISDGPMARADAGDNAIAQLQQAGIHHDGIISSSFSNRASSRRATTCAASTTNTPTTACCIATAWQANQFPNATGGRPRSATLVITRPNGKPVAG